MKFQYAAPALLFLVASASGFGSYPVAFGNALSAKATTQNKVFSINKVLNPRGGAIVDHFSSTHVASATMTETGEVEVVTNFVSEENLSLLSPRGKAALINLIQGDIDNAQAHVYADWPTIGTNDEEKIKLCEQLADLDNSYPGGLTSYLTKAKKLLKESADGTNPFLDFTASVPVGESLLYDGDGADGQTGMSFSEAEQVGLTGIADVAFVLVAGGLGERLGYSGIKLSLETNLCTNKSYLEVYAKYIQAMQRMAQKKTGRDDIRIPLVIMTSGDTDPLTRQLIRDNNNFGFEEGQLQIVCQDKVAALKDSNAGLSLSKDSRWEVETKPHGHGDVHHLLYREGHVEKWAKEGKKHVVFLQDTNALVINSILPTL